VEDPYEARMVYVSESRVKGAGEGLFVNQDVPARFVSPPLLHNFDKQIYFFCTAFSFV